MAYQRVAKTAEISVIFGRVGYEFRNTYHAEFGGNYAQGDLDSLASAVDAQANNLMSDISGNVEYIRTDVRGLDSEFDLTSTNNTGAKTGDVGSNTFPFNVAFCVQKLSGLTGRSARGRVYIGGIPVSYQATGAGSDKNEITSAAAAAYVAHVDAIRTAIEAIGAWNAVIVSRYHNGSKRAEGVTFQWTVTQAKDDKLDTMRTRLS